MKMLQTGDYSIDYIKSLFKSKKFKNGDIISTTFRSSNDNSYMTLIYHIINIYENDAVCRLLMQEDNHTGNKRINYFMNDYLERTVKLEIIEEHFRKIQ